MSIRCVSAFVMNDNHNQCIIDTEDVLPVMTLYWSESQDEYQKENRIGNYSSKCFMFPRVPNRGKRIYYHLEMDDRPVVHFSERILRVAGMYNLRDMGGYPTVDGRHVKWGMLYRSDQLYNVEAEAIPLLNQLGIKTIVDLRSPEEVKRHPNVELNTVECTVNLDPNAHIAAFAGALQNNELNDRSRMIEIAQSALEKDEQAGDQQMIAQQRSFVLNKDSQESFKEAIHLMKKGGPLLHHCKGGKDRTGFMAMMELAILGVEEDYIMQDYMLTREARKHKNKKYYDRFLRLTGSARYAEFYYSLFDTKASYLQAAIDAILSRYDSLLAYAMEVYDLSDKDIVAIRSLYLT